MATTPIVYNQTTQDIASETRVDPRYIGILDLNRSRLNVHSALTRRQDDQDVYRFRVTRGGTLGIGASVLVDNAISTENNGNIRIEILDRSSRVVADSKAKEGSELLKNYNAAQADKLALKNGDYYVRITRDRSIPKTEAVEYTFQLRNGIYRQDYDTTETPPTIATNTSPKVLGISAVAQQLNTYRTSLIGENSIFSTLSTLI